MGKLGLVLAVADTRDLVALPENDFSRCPWESPEDALNELDDSLEALFDDRVPDALSTLFLPTGALQELSVASGWGDEFVEIAARFDEELDKSDCSCLIAPFSHGAFESRVLGIDHTATRHSEVSLVTCAECDRAFLHYSVGVSASSDSGRWYRAPLPLRSPTTTPANALHLLTLAPFHFLGGNYFETTGVLASYPFEGRL
jgi:hypothetical protein